jgi:hypothetical protein
MRYAWSALFLAYVLQIIGVCVIYGSFAWLPIALFPAATAIALVRRQSWAKAAAFVTSIMAITSWSIALRASAYDSTFHIDAALTALVWLTTAILCPIAVRRIVDREDVEHGALTTQN